MMVITPGPLLSRRLAEDGPLFAEETNVVSLDRVNYRSGLQSDTQAGPLCPR